MSSSRRSDIIFAVALVVALLIAYYLRHALLLIYVSILFAIVLTPAVQFIQKLSIGDGIRARLGGSSAPD